MHSLTDIESLRGKNLLKGRSLDNRLFALPNEKEERPLWSWGFTPQSAPHADSGGRVGPKTYVAQANAIGDPLFQSSTNE
jgi:hypothetical protein